MIPYARQSINAQDIAALTAALESDFLTQGPRVAEFQENIARYCGVKFAHAVSNATAALHVAYLGLGLGKGDLLWTSPNTFVATANMALLCGAEVDFVDIDPNTLNLDVQKLRDKLVAAKKLGRLPKIIAPVHFGGLSCPMKEIFGLSKEYGFKIVEDASHAIGGSYEGQKIGSCTYSDCTVFSFHAVKIITTGEGGMLTTNDPDLAQAFSLLRSHGVTRDTKLMRGSSPGDWYYEQIALGHNFRLPDLLCALGSSQLKRIGTFVETRNRLAEVYKEAFAALPLKMQAISPHCQSAYHLFVVELIEQTHRDRRAEIFAMLREQSILVNVHYMPVYWQPYYQALGFKKGLCPVAESYYEGAITLPLFPDLKSDEQFQVIAAIKENLK